MPRNMLPGFPALPADPIAFLAKLSANMSHALGQRRHIGGETRLFPAQANCAPADSDLSPASISDLPQHIASAQTLPVQSFAPNPWGLYQVHGNVYDWVEDCWNDNYSGAPSDGSPWISGNCSRHVLRGGAFSRKPQAARSAARIWFGPPNRLVYMSVRVARTLER